MSVIRLTVLCLLAATCTSSNPGSGKCHVQAPGAAALTKIAHGTQLATSVHAALIALASGDPSNPALADTGFEDPSTSGQQPVARALQCLAVTRWNDEGPFIAFYLAPVTANGRAGPEEFLMLATYHDSRWRFTWPAELGGPGY